MLLTPYLRTLSACICVFLFCTYAQADAAKEAEAILTNKCLTCHGGDMKGGLDLRTAAAALKGGKSGAALVPGDAGASKLLQLVEAGEMPPKEKLSAAEVDAIRAWINEGARYPAAGLDAFATTTDKRAGLDWWSLQALKEVTPPALDEEAGTWREHPIDAFVYAALQQAGLHPAPPAEPRTLIRRATYDLLGLPPTPEEVDSFEAQCAAETGTAGAVGDKAYAALLDRLLASPHYGEQWGRHWLDVARYGESNGYERNVLFDNIWPYRDYVIESFNNDKPFYKFVLEQLAADAIAPGDPKTEVALTFLVCGPFDDVGNSDPVQAAQIRSNAVDEMVRAASDAFLGLTFGCARCHDHKFDPISTKDYYKLYATFAGVTHGDREVATTEQLAAREAALQPLEAEKDRIEAERTALRDAVDERANAVEESLATSWTRPPVNRRGTEETFAPVQAKFVRLVSEARDNDPISPAGFRIDEFEAFTSGPSPKNVAASANGGRAQGESRQPGDFAEAYDAALTIDGQYGARWNASEPELTIEFAEPATIERVLFSSDRLGALAIDHGEIPFPCEYRIETSLNGAAWTVVASSHDREPANAAHRNKRLIDAVITEEERAKIAAFDAQIAAVEEKIAAVPAFPSLRVGRYAEPEAQVVFIGGDPQRKGDPVVPASPSTLATTAKEYTLADETPEQQRRLKFAQWLVHKDNPLTPRVLANRLWHYHFGAGLVKTPSDFGYMGARPTHPELLDWLARELMLPSLYADEPLTEVSLPASERLGQAWRLKRMHKLIMLSQTYRQASTWREHAARVDGDSALLWRFPPRRLRAEEIRDSILAIAGKLDPSMGGPGFRLYEYLQDNVATYVPLDEHGPETYRRAVYHQNARAQHLDLMTDFDAPDCAMPAPRRDSTTSPLQALTMMNHQFTTDMADALAARVAAEAGPSLADQVRRAYALAFTRMPGPEEQLQAVALAELHGMDAFCRALLNASELIYVE